MSVTKSVSGAGWFCDRHQGLHCLLDICINLCETVLILPQWYEKCVQHNLELAHKQKKLWSKI